jgi:hypothetical protein
VVKDFAAFIIKNNRSNIVMIILFACLVGWLNSSLVEMKKEIRHNLKNHLGWHEYRHGHASARANVTVHALTRATILCTVCPTD